MATALWASLLQDALADGCAALSPARSLTAASGPADLVTLGERVLRQHPECGHPSRRA